MDDLRAEIEAACQEADRLKLEFERDEWQRVQRSQLQTKTAPELKRRDAGFGVQHGRPIQQQSTTMDAATSDAWNRWMTDYVTKRFADYHEALSEDLTEAFGEAMSTYVHERLEAEIAKLREEIAQQNEKLREEISGLRIDSAVSRSILRGEINDIMKKKTRA